MKRTLRALALATTLLVATTAQATLLQGASYITASTTLPTCGFFCGYVGSDIRQIADGDVSNLNGWAGGNGLVGTIKLDLTGTWDITSFSLWNDINIVREGVGDFKLHFYDDNDVLISDSAVYTAPIGSFAPGVYNFAPVRGVGRVDLEVLTLLTGGACCRIEIREVAFNGNAPSAQTVPEPSAALLAGLGLVLAGAATGVRYRPSGAPAAG